MAFYDTWPGGLEVLLAPLFMALAVVTALGLRLLPLRDQRPLPRRALHDPGPPPGAAAPLGRHLRGRRSCPTKWQWVLALNPMTAVISGWRWAVLDAPPPDLRQIGARRRGRRARIFVGRPRGLPLVRAALRGHDLMAVAIEAEGSRKRYRLGEFQAAYGTLRESLVARREGGSRARSTAESHEEIWALRGRLVRGRSRARCSASSAGTAPASRRC